MWFVGQIGKSSKGNPLWSYKQTLTLIFVHGWDQHIYGKYQVCTQQQSHWQLKITRKKQFVRVWFVSQQCDSVGGPLRLPLSVGQGRIWAEWHCEYADPQVWPVQWRGAPRQDPDGSRAAAPPRPCCLLQPLLLRLQHPCNPCHHAMSFDVFTTSF